MRSWLRGSAASRCMPRARSPGQSPERRPALHRGTSTSPHRHAQAGPDAVRRWLGPAEAAWPHSSPQRGCSCWCLRPRGGARCCGGRPPRRLREVGGRWTPDGHLMRPWATRAPLRLAVPEHDPPPKELQMVRRMNAIPHSGLSVAAARQPTTVPPPTAVTAPAAVPGRPQRRRPRRRGRDLVQGAGAALRLPALVS